MTIGAGVQFGPYQVLSALGAGGMGEVYRARDATLNRDVALKVLPELFALDRDRLARFKREAQVLASLNHPNIAAIYGFEESTGVQALVLELVEGATLADRIAHGPIVVEDALPIARQIAEALEAAHEQGIVHRDLKPANIKVRPDGAVKVLDFGLAKALEPAGMTGGDVMSSPTITSPAMTQLGMILGTAAYMSPEQAKGRQADKRSDVWAFGAVLYEMLSGQRAFKGDDVSDTLAAVLRQDIDWNALPVSTPAPVRRLMARCLERDVRRRLRDIGEARIVLDDPAALTPGDPGNVRTAALGPARRVWRRAIPVVLSILVTGVLAATAAWSFKPSPPLRVTRFLFTLPDGQLFSGAGRRMIDISPDGDQIVYTSNGRLYLRPLPEVDAKPIPGTEIYQNVVNPVFSPDGRSVAFFATSDQTIKTIAVSGGTAVTLCTAAMPFGMSWGANGIVFSQGSQGISLVSAEGGTPPEVLVTLKDGEIAASPQMLPSGRDLLFAVATGTALNRWDTADIVVQSIGAAERKIIIKGGDPRYIPTGHLVYAIGNSVYAVSFDDRSMKTTGSPAPVVAGVRRASVDSDGANFGISSNGILVYIPGTSSPSSGQWEIALTDRRRGIETLKLPPGHYAVPRVSPNGTRIAFGTDDGNEAIIHTYALSGESGIKRLTFGGKNRYPIWIANDRVAFQSDQDGDLAIWWQPIEGGGPAKRLTTPEPGTSHVPDSWSAKVDTFLFDVVKGADVSLWTYSMRDRKAQRFGNIQSSKPTNAVFSPSGGWVAYTSTEQNRQNRPRNYVQPFPPSGPLHELPGGPFGFALHPLWSPDEKELFYNPAPSQFAWVSVETQPTFAVGNPEMVATPFKTGGPEARRQYDISPDGKLVGLVEREPPEVRVVLNWFEELRARVPPR